MDGIHGNGVDGGGVDGVKPCGGGGRLRKIRYAEPAIGGRDSATASPSVAAGQAAAGSPFSPAAAVAPAPRRPRRAKRPQPPSAAVATSGPSAGIT